MVTANALGASVSHVRGPAGRGRWVPAAQPPPCVASALPAASPSQVVGDVLLGCEQTQLRAACWGRRVR